MSPLALREVQRGFWSSLHRGEPDPTLAAAVLPSPLLDASDRIGIYAGMYFWRLFDVLREDFPKVCAALGDDFEALARRYLARHPSEHPSVRHLGRRVPDFLATDDTAVARPWLVDLARLELARVNAFDAPDDVPVRAADLCAIAPDAWAELRFRPVAAVAILRSAWPVHELWSLPTATDVRRHATTVRVWRHDFAVFHAATDPLEAEAFALLAEGGTFATICEVVAEHVPADGAAAEAGALLARWIEDGLVAGLVV